MLSVSGFGRDRVKNKEIRMSFFIYNDKKVYYKEYGTGAPIVIIHGNTASSKMHGNLTKQLKKTMKVISIDLPGHGKSDRIKEWPIDFWYEHCKVIESLISHLGLENVTLLGYSGGAQIALNTVLEYPDKISRVIADSFEGERSVSRFAENIFKEREKSKNKFFAKFFWQLMHGSDWENIVDCDSRVIFEHHKNIKTFFRKDLSEISQPVLLTGSHNDEYIDSFEEIYKPMCDQIPLAMVKIYTEGKHPASLTVKRYVKDVLFFIEET